MADKTGKVLPLTREKNRRFDVWIVGLPTGKPDEHLNIESIWLTEEGATQEAAELSSELGSDGFLYKVELMPVYR